MGSSSTWYFSGWISVFLGDPETAIPHFEHVMRFSPRDPLTFHTLNGLAWSHFFAGRCDDAFSWSERALRENPNCKPALRISAAGQALLGRMDGAKNTVSRFRRLRSWRAAGASRAEAFDPQRTTASAASAPHSRSPHERDGFHPLVPSRMPWFRPATLMS